MDDVLDRQTEGFSQGQRTKTAIARALVHDPRNVILDEPTNGLDVMTTRGLREFLRQLRGEGRCVIFSSHIMQEVAALCDRIVVIAHGKRGGAGHAPTNCARRPAKHNLEDAFVQADRLGRGTARMKSTHVRRVTMLRRNCATSSRDRRTLVIALLMGPLLMPVLMLGIGKLAENRAQEPDREAAATCRWSAPSTRRTWWPGSQGQNIVVEAGAGDPDAAIRSQDEDVILRIDGDFGEQWRGRHAGGGGDPARLLAPGRATSRSSACENALEQLRPAGRRAAPGRARHHPGHRRAAARQRPRPGHAGSARAAWCWRSCPTC